MMTNPGDMPLSYQILPAVDASKGDDLGSLQDLVDEAGPRSADFKHGWLKGWFRSHNMANKDIFPIFSL